MKYYLYLIVILIIPDMAFSATLEEFHKSTIDAIEDKNGFNNDILVEKNMGFYRLNPKSEQNEIENIRNSLDLSEGQYGFSLDVLTQNVCGNKIIDDVREFNKGNDAIFLYSASCMDWCGEGPCGKSHYAVIRKKKIDTWCCGLT